MITRTGTRLQARVVVTGLAATYPLGGVFWDYLQYVLGFHRLGCDVLYLEDTGRWCYDPAAQTFTDDASTNVATLAREIARLDPSLANRWFFRDAAGKTYGRSERDALAFVRSADLFLHISASCWMRDEYLTSRTVAFIDSDPMYTQASLLAGSATEDRLSWWTQRHHVFFTFGENVGSLACGVPTAGLRWNSTRQPIVLEEFHHAAIQPAARRQVFTTVASWEPSEKGPFVDGVSYGGKSIEFRRFINLPARSSLPLEVALSGPAPRDELRSKGWNLIDPYPVSRDPWVYRDYLANSLAEVSIAKNAYTASRSGWFSCRSACYLALGVPVVVQDTGFGIAIPTGDGVHAFSTMDEAAAAIDRVQSDPEGQSEAALEIAREYFDADKVLLRLLEEAIHRPPNREPIQLASPSEVLS